MKTNLYQTSQTLFISFMVAILLNGCAFMQRAEANEVLSKRVEGLMTATINNDWGKTYTYFDSSFRQKEAKDVFINKPRVLDYTKYTIELIEMAPSGVTATVKVKYDVSFNNIEFKDKIITQKWIMEEDGWYVQVASDSQESKLFRLFDQHPSEDPSKDKLTPIEILQKSTRAQLDGKYVFLMFYETGNSECEIMSQRLDEYEKSNEEKVEIIRIDRNDPEYSTIVASMNVQNAPLPTTLIKGLNGRVIKAFKTVVSKDEIRYAIPSPKKSEVKAALKEGKSVILSFTSKTMLSENSIEKTCAEAIKILKEESAYVNVDITDDKERGFLREMRINPESEEPVTIVFNSERRISGTYKGTANADDLVRSAREVGLVAGCSKGHSHTKPFAGALGTLGCSQGSNSSEDVKMDVKTNEVSLFQIK